MIDTKLIEAIKAHVGREGHGAIKSLAEAAGVTAETVRNVKAGRAANSNTLEAIRTALPDPIQEPLSLDGAFGIIADEMRVLVAAIDSPDLAPDQKVRRLQSFIVNAYRDMIDPE